METLDYIEWLVEHAEGFNLNGDQLFFPEGGCEPLNEELTYLTVWKLVWFPLLLVMAHDASRLDPVKTDKSRNYWLKELYTHETGKKT